MRLSKTDVGEVRMVCARTVYNLAIDPQNIDALRKNYVISFVKELCSEEGTPYLDIFLSVLDHIIYHAALHTPLNTLETISIIQVLISSLLKVASTESCRWIGYLLSKVALLATEGSEFSEFVNMDIVNVLGKSISTWAEDAECRQHFSAVLCIITTNNAFTLASPFHEVQFILDFLIMHVMYDAKGNANHRPLDLIICENISQTIMNYVSRDQADVKNVINLSFFESLMIFALTGSSFYDRQELEKKRLHDFQENENQAQTTESQNKAVGVANLKVIFIQILTFVLPELLKYKKIGRVRGERSSSPDKKDRVEKVPSIIEAIPIRTFLDIDLFLDKRTQRNVMRLVHLLCSNKTLASEFVELGLIAFLDTLVHTIQVSTSGVVVNFCSNVCRNLSTHEKVGTQLVAAPQLTSLLNKLVAIASESLRNEAFRRYSLVSLSQDNQSVLVGQLFGDICVMLFNISVNPLSEDEHLTSECALSIISEITAVTENKDLSHIAKITIGKILDHSEVTTGFDPSYIAAILSEINDANALDPERIIELASAKPLMNSVAEFAPIFSASIIEKENFVIPSAADLWKPIVFNERKRMEFTKIEIENGGTKASVEKETSKYPISPFPLNLYAKISVTYPFLTTPANISGQKNSTDLEGSLNLIEEGNDSGSHSRSVEGSSMLSGFTSFEQDVGSVGREELSVSTVGSKPRSVKSPAPPSSGRKSTRDTKVNRQQRKVVASNISAGDHDQKQPKSPKDVRFKGV